MTCHPDSLSRFIPYNPGLYPLQQKLSLVIISTRGGAAGRKVQATLTCPSVPVLILTDAPS